MVDKFGEQLAGRMMATAPLWERVLVWAFKRLPAPLSRRIAPRWGRDLLAWVQDAQRRRAGWPEVEAHLRELGMTEEQVAPFKALYISRLQRR